MKQYKSTVQTIQNSKYKYTYLSHVIQSFVSAGYVQTQMLKAVNSSQLQRNKNISLSADLRKCEYGA